MPDIQFDPTATKKELVRLYRFLPETKRLLRTYGCDEVTAEDLFQEALVIYLRKKEEPGFQFEREPIHYVKQTCKLLWFNEARKLQKQASESLTADVPEEEKEWLQTELRFKYLERAVEQLGKQCKEILQLFYTWGWSMTDIAKKVGLRNEKVAKAQKYRCIQKAKELVNEVRVDVESMGMESWK